MTRKIILAQTQSPGDILTMSRAIGDLKESFPEWSIDVRSPAPEIYHHNKRLTPLKKGDPGVEYHQIGYDDINISGWNGLHFTDAFRRDIERKLGVTIKKTGIRPELWVSEGEANIRPHLVYHKADYAGPYWILNAGRKPDNELKFYHRWQEFVDLFNEHFKGAVRLVQIGHESHIHPKLTGVIDLIGKTTLRELIVMAYRAEGSIGPLSLQFVISAAFEQPHVVLAAGKEGVRWHIYPHGRYLYTNGALECCKWDGCWLGGVKGHCKNLISYNGTTVPRCFDLIQPYQIIDAVEMYYKGGRIIDNRLDLQSTIVRA
jgi:ADP-heptose:LPS heptosyltransferase